MFRRDNVASRFRIVIAIGLVVSLFTASFSAMAQEDNNDNGDNGDNGVSYNHDFNIHGFDFHSPEFYNVWARTDLPVLQGEVERSWLWGPAANTPVFEEPYAEAADGMREVQYSDKSRMEMPVPGSAAAADDEDSPWNITQGLLATELMTGQLQLGDDTFEQYAPAEIPVAGDWEDNPGPTYADMAAYMDFGARTTGWDITQYFDEDGVVRDDDRFAEYEVYDRYHIPETDHNIASVFWDFMQSEGLIYDGEGLSEGPLFLNEFYAIGFPITEAYWGEFRLRGEVQDILIQCFERRCLTYAPNNPVEWQVESGNVGLHYHMWRYTQIDEPIVPDPDPELSLVVDPAEATNPVGSEHTITATVMENGTAQAITEAEDVSIEVVRTTTDENGDENGTNDDTDNGNNDNGVVDVEETITLTETGVASIVYTGPDFEAVDEITVNVEFGDETLTSTATKTWAEVEPEPELSLVLDPVEDTNPVGSDHTITATVMENGTAQAISGSDDVSITVARGDDNDVDVNENIAVETGVASITYTGPAEPAVDTITVAVEYGDETLTGSATKTWAEVEPEPELSGTFDYDGEATARVEVGEDIVLTAHLTENGDDLDGETVYFWISEGDEDIIEINPFHADTSADGTAVVTVTGVAAGSATVNAFVDLDDTGVYNPDTDLDLGSVEVIVGPIAPAEFEGAASGADNVVGDDQLEDGREFWQIEIFLTEEDLDANEPLNPQAAWDAGDLTRIIYERPDGTTVELEPEGTEYLWWVGTYADGQHTIYYLVNGEWYAVTSTFEDGELIAVGGEAYVSS
jgi:hypothetical protein